MSNDFVEVDDVFIQATATTTFESLHVLFYDEEYFISPQNIRPRESQPNSIQSSRNVAQSTSQPSLISRLTALQSSQEVNDSDIQNYQRRAVDLGGSALSLKQTCLKALCLTVLSLII